MPNVFKNLKSGQIKLTQGPGGNRSGTSWVWWRKQGEIKDRKILKCTSWTFHILNASVMLTGFLMVSLSTFGIQGSQYAAAVQVIAGSFTVIVAIIGCFGVTENKSAFILAYAILLIVTFFGILVVTVLLVYHEDTFESSATYFMLYSFKHYADDTKNEQTVDSIQLAAKCCGLDGPRDWFKFRHDTKKSNRIPRSCCPKIKFDDDCILEKAFRYGCKKPITAFLKEVRKITVLFAFVMLPVLLIGAITAFVIRMKQKRLGLYKTSAPPPERPQRTPWILNVL